MDWSEYKVKIKEAIASGNVDSAESLLIEAIEFLKVNNGTVERITVCLDQLGWIYIGRKEFVKANERYLQSLELKLDALGKDHPIVARAYKKLATVAYMMEDFESAEKFGKEALNNFKNSLGLDNEETLQTQKDVAELLRRLNRHVEADIIESSGQPQPTKKRETVQTFLRITICENCEAPFDGDQCPRCNA